MGNRNLAEMTFNTGSSTYTSGAHISIQLEGCVFKVYYVAHATILKPGRVILKSLWVSVYVYYNGIIAVV